MLPTFKHLWRAVSDALAVPPAYDHEFASQMQVIHAQGYEARRQMDIRAATIIQDLQEAADASDDDMELVILRDPFEFLRTR